MRRASQRLINKRNNAPPESSSIREISTSHLSSVQNSHNLLNMGFIHDHSKLQLSSSQNASQISSIGLNFNNYISESISYTNSLGMRQWEQNEFHLNEIKKRPYEQINYNTNRLQDSFNQINLLDQGQRWKYEKPQLRSQQKKFDQISINSNSSIKGILNEMQKRAGKSQIQTVFYKNKKFPYQ